MSFGVIVETSLVVEFGGGQVCVLRPLQRRLQVGTQAGESVFGFESALLGFCHRLRRVGVTGPLTCPGSRLRGLASALAGGSGAGDRIIHARPSCPLADLHERAADLHQQAAEIHERAAQRHEAHAEEFIHSPLIVERSLGLAANEKRLAQSERTLADEQRARGPASSAATTS